MRSLREIIKSDHLRSGVTQWEVWSEIYIKANQRVYENMNRWIKIKEQFLSNPLDYHLFSTFLVISFLDRYRSLRGRDGR